MHVDILGVAEYFSEPRRNEEKYDEQKCMHVLYVKPSDNRFIIPPRKDFVILVSLLWYLIEIHPALSVYPAVYQCMARANDVNNTTGQTKTLKCITVCILRVFLTLFGEMI